MQQRKQDGYTYEDYLTWDDDTRYELIDGEAYMMAPAPTTAHQAISVSLASQFYNYLRGKTCRVFAAPFDVRLSEDTVVQPDISVICDPGKLDARGCNGAPDLVVEILSPSSVGHDSVVKLNTYNEAGVREYWIVDPDSRSVLVYLFKGGEGTVRVYGEKAVIAAHVLDGLQVELDGVFPPPEPKAPEKKKGPDITPA